ncbi:4'-phosphopantetheinyl transferase superfamily, putative [Angomonas deanei]|uniref:holo-[acyl-carrier-protein] synthase n=1 Tax=Angomonas deanei TaxID=59799 RepID=A0A7G2C871_9TRYP|nr:4'-phosphopantetheinyl transferase superfamily, putative [Angomonas deanei]
MIQAHLLKLPPQNSIEKVNELLSLLNPNDDVARRARERLRLAPPTEEEQAKAIRQVVSWLTARTLLLIKVTEASANQRVIKDRTLARNELGKPLLEPYHCVGSVSHEDSLVGVVVLPDEEQSIGLDIAKVDPTLSAWYALALTSEEKKEVIQGVAVDLYYAYYWSLKEAVLKGLGVGLSSAVNLQDICIEACAPAPSHEGSVLLPLRVVVQGKVRQWHGAAMIARVGEETFVVSVVTDYVSSDGIGWCVETAA